MMIGIASNSPADWVKEFENSCVLLKLPYRVVNVRRHDWMEAVRGLDILMWRIHLGDQSGIREARVKIPLLQEMGIKCFPNAEMAGLYDDKIRQTFFLQRNNYPIPETFVSFEQADALAYAESARYPMVAKTSGGASSSGVSLVRNRSEAERIIRGVFKPEARLIRAVRSRVKRALATMRPLAGPSFLTEWSNTEQGRVQHYVYFQEYIQTSGDVRVVTLGPELVSAFSRRNRPNDFRASGSGLLEQFPKGAVPTDPCEMALQISQTHGFSSMAYDFLFSKRGWLIGELSYTFLLHRPPWGYAEALYERQDGRFVKVAPIPIGVLHLQAMLEPVAS